MKKNTPILTEAHRLYELGGAVHWLAPKSKRPVESGWTTGERKPWKYLAETYYDGLNVGMRLGDASKIGDSYLAVIDVDVKSKDARHRKEAVAAAKKLLGDKKAPVVLSGRGNGSRHYYVLTPEPFKTFNTAQSSEMVKVEMPSKKPSKAEIATLSPKELAAGVRLSHAWEISVYSNGRQVVVPPSVHPDSGQPYTWYSQLTHPSQLPLINLEAFRPVEGESGDIAGPKASVEPSAIAKEWDEPTERAREAKSTTLENFVVEPVDIEWLPISEKVRDGILYGTNVSDRSGYLLQASVALLSAGLSQNEMLSVLTDRETFLGEVGYDHAKTDSRTKAAEWVYKYTLKKVMTERSAQGVFINASERPEEVKLDEDQTRKQTEEILRDYYSWQKGIARGGNNGDGNPKATIENVVLIITNEVGRDVVRRNLFAYRDTYGVNTPWGAKAGDPIPDDDIAMIKYWLGQTYNFEPKTQVISDALVVIAIQNAYDPVLDYLNSLPDWDGTNRLDTWLKDNFEATGCAEYLAQVFRKWMVAMVMRAYQPGAKFDWMPIFEGKQGVGKSSFGRLLVGQDYFLDWLGNLADKDSALALQGMWGVEMGELANMRKSELEVVKGYITRTVDKVRPPFGRRWLEAPRRCVFFGTTNRETYLSDDSGNRRFKPLMVGKLNFKALKRDRAQLFAEAKYLFNQKIETEITLELSGEAKIYEAEIHGDKMVEDESILMQFAMLDFIKKYEKKEVHFDFKKFRIFDLFQGGGSLTDWKMDNRNSQFAAKMLRKMGAKDRKINGLRYWEMPKMIKNDDPPPTNDFY